MKTPKQMAEEYCHEVPISGFDRLFVSLEEIRIGAFKNGYQAAQQWISVKDRLPEDGDDSSIMLVWRKIEHDYDTVRWKYQEGWDCVIQDKSTVTHWMPLPKPPKE